MNVHADQTRFLRNALMLDGVVSGLGGALLLAVPGPIATLIGVSSAAVVAGVGVALIVYGLGLWTNARRPVPRRGEVALTLALNAAWLVGTAVVIEAGGLTRLGNWILLLVGDAVLTVLALEIVGLRKMTAASLATRPT